MVKKSITRFYIFGLALMAMLCLFGVEHDHSTIHKAGKPVFSLETSSIHSNCPYHQPFEIENREEQPSTEDDESRESSSATLSDNCFSSEFVRVSTGQPDNISSSKSQTQYHTPAYVRLRSILI